MADEDLDEISMTDKLRKASTELVIGNDPEMATLYQDSIYQAQLDVNQDYNRELAYSERFDYLNDKDAMKGKIKSSKYDYKNEPNIEEDDLLTTELTDEAENEFYIRYKVAKQKEVDINEAGRIEKLMASWRLMQRGERALLTRRETVMQMKEFNRTVIKKEKIDAQMEGVMA